MEWIRLVGYVAAASTTISFLPQAIRTFKTKDTRAISLGMYVLYTFGVLMWLIYGIGKKDIPIILANGVSLILAAVILVYKIRYK